LLNNDFNLIPGINASFESHYQAASGMQVANEQRFYIFLKCNMKAFISQSRADRTGCWG